MMMMRVMKRGLEEDEDEDGEEESEESVLKERRAFDEGESWSSWSWVGSGVGFVEVNADKGLEPMFDGVVLSDFAGSSEVLVMGVWKRKREKQVVKVEEKEKEG